MVMKRIILWAWIGLILVAAVLPIGPASVNNQAHAANPTATWVTASEIQLTNIPFNGDGLYVTTETNLSKYGDGTAHWTRQNAAGCTDYVYVHAPNNDITQPGATAFLQQVTKDQFNTTCHNGSKFTITPIGSPNLAAINFVWVDSGTIASAPGDKTYSVSQSASGSRFQIFLQTNDTGQCKDFITIASGLPITLTYASDQPIKNAGGNNMGNTSNSNPYAFYSVSNVNIQYANTKNPTSGCYQTTGTIQIGHNVNATLPPGSGTGPGGSANGGPAYICNVPYISWIVCPLITIGYDVIKWLDGAVEGLLVTPDLSSSQPVWNVMKDFANVLFVLVFLFIIFGNLFSFQVDSYTVKKMLPRLIAAAILVQFSFFLGLIAVDLSNVIGHGILTLIQNVGPNQNQTGYQIAGGIISGLGVLGVVGTGVAIAVTQPEIIVGIALTGLFLIGAAIISIFGVFFTLTFRLILIQLALILSPIALVAWILPNTNRVFKFWYQNLLKALIMYPLVTLLIRAAMLFNQIGDATTGNFATHLAATIAPIVAFFMIPATFKMAGGFMSAVSGAVLARTSAASKRARTGPAATNAKNSLKRQGALLAGNPESGKALRMLGNVTSGQIGFGKASRYKRAGAYTTALAEEGKFVEEDLRKKGIASNNAELKDFYYNKDGKGAKTEAERVAALRLLGENGGLEELSSIYHQFVKDNGGVTESSGWSKSARETWERGTANSRADMAKALPYAARPDGDDSILKLNAEQWVSMKGAGGADYQYVDAQGQTVTTNHIQNALVRSAERLKAAEADKVTYAANPASAEYQGAVAAHQKEVDNQRRLVSTIVSVGQSTDRRGRNDVRNTRAFKSLVEQRADLFAPEVLESAQQTATYLDSNGQYTQAIPGDFAPGAAAPAPETLLEPVEEE